MRGTLLRMGISLDLSRAHKVKPYGDLLAVFTWVNNERALVLLPAHRKNAGWFVVCDSALHRYTEPGYLANAALKACSVLGMEATPRNAVKVGEIVMAEIPDIIRMPLAQPPEKPSPTIGEARIYQEGKLLGGQEVTVDGLLAEYED